MFASISKLIRRSLLAIVVVLFASPLQAQTATNGFTRWVGVGNTAAWSSYRAGTVQWNVFTSPYRAQFQIPSNSTPALMPSAGTTSFGSVADIFCIDFKHYANTNTTTGYATKFTNLGQTNNDAIFAGTTTRSGNTLAHYLQAAWLASEIAGSSADSVGDINGAIWQIMSGQPMERRNINGVWSAAGIDGWIHESEKMYRTVNASNWVVVTDAAAVGKNAYATASGGSQEYLTQVTPEPATLLLLGTGLLGMLVAAGTIRRVV